MDKTLKKCLKRMQAEAQVQLEGVKGLDEIDMDALTAAVKSFKNHKARCLDGNMTDGYVELRFTKKKN